MRPAIAAAAVITAGTGWWLLFGPIVWADPRFTIYQAAFVGTLAVAWAYAVMARDLRALWVSAVLTTAWAVHQVVHASGTHPLSLHGSINLAVATVILVFARERWEAVVALCYLAIVLSGALAHFGVIPTGAERPRAAFIAWSYPDVAALLGHLANVVTGSAADVGRGAHAVDRVAWLRRPVGLALVRIAARGGG